LRENVVGLDDLPGEDAHTLDDTFAAIRDRTNFRRMQRAYAGYLVHELPSGDAPAPDRAAVDAGRTPDETDRRAGEKREDDSRAGEGRYSTITASARIGSLDVH